MAQEFVSVAHQEADVNVDEEECNPHCIVLPQVLRAEDCDGQNRTAATKPPAIIHAAVRKGPSRKDRHRALMDTWLRAGPSLSF